MTSRCDSVKPLLVLGVGNLLLKDEGFGVQAIHEFWKEKDLWPGVDFMDGGTFTQDIFFLFEAYRNVLVLDIVRAGQPPGTRMCLEEDDLRRDTPRRLSLHDIDLLDSLTMAAMRGHRPYLRVIGIEPEQIDWGLELTPTLSRIMPEYLNLVRHHIRDILDTR